MASRYSRSVWRAAFPAALASALSLAPRRKAPVCQSKRRAYFLALVLVAVEVATA
jgi:hypothetical protein